MQVIFGLKLFVEEYKQKGNSLKCGRYFCKSKIIYSIWPRQLFYDMYKQNRCIQYLVAHSRSCIIVNGAFLLI